jgi:putative membrane protein
MELLRSDPDVGNLRRVARRVPPGGTGNYDPRDVTATPGNDDVGEFDSPRPLDPRDYSRRTLLANERTYLAWWRTGLTTLAVALACARVVPDLSDTGTTWPYTVVGAGFAALGVICIAYGERRRVAVNNAIRRGEFAEIGSGMSLLLTVAGVGLGVAITVLILVNP